MSSDMTEGARARKTESYDSQTTSSQTTSSRARQSDTLFDLFDHDSNVLLSPAFSATTVDSRPVSGISCLPSPTFRDSIISIVNDPFFQNLRDIASQSDRGDSADDEDDGHFREPVSPTAEDYDDGGSSSRGDALHREGPTTTHDAGSDVHAELLGENKADRNSNSSSRYSRAHSRRESSTIGMFPSASGLPHWTSFAAMESLNIAIIGAHGVGKSSFVQRVLGLSRPPISNSSILRLVIDNQNYSVTLLELDLEHFDTSPTAQPIQWPKQINGHILPRVDGALILYDVTNKETIMELPRTLDALTNSGLPSVLVACKCDASDNARQVDADGMANHDLFKACVANYNISSNKPEHSRACLKTIIRTVIAKRRDDNGESATSRRRAASVAQLDAPTDPSSARPLSQHSKHSRASSDLSLLRGFSNPPVSAEQYRGHHPTRSPRFDSPSGPASKSQPACTTTFAAEPVDSGSQTVSSQLRRPGVRLDLAAQDSFLDMDESDAESSSFHDLDDTPILQRNDEAVDEVTAAAAGAVSPAAKTPGVSFDELVDRLVAPRMTKADHSYSDIFLCLYRKFASPSQLFLAVLDRLDRVRDDRTSHYLTKTATQLRMIEVIAKWVSLYPGDFARPRTKRDLRDFVKHLSTEPIFFTSAQQIRHHLERYVVEDDDTWWAMADDPEDVPPTPPDKDGPPGGVDNLQLDDDSAAAEQDPRKGGAGGSGAFEDQNPILLYEEYERRAARLEPSAHLPMDKSRYHSFMVIPDEDVAEEMTRIDWAMFSSIRIRDFVRHVGLSAEDKERCRSLKNVNRMIGHFNHVAKWVANMILLRDKPKHRAQTLEKFMNVATRLRQMNNYNGLAAVLAGINGSAIHRLAQTRALVPADVQKNFARLVILMGSQKSHFAYRLAWENSPLPRIPFVPLHRRDLISAEEGSRTMVGPAGDRINWKKFEILGEVLLPIMKSQGTAYGKLGRHDTAKELILDFRMATDEEEIYERSVQLEPSTGGSTESTRKKFAWFAK